ncbi:MAG: cyclic nucleotide-binding domain-containing protein [Candidatus Latescibacteria bacterium]|nr:cyclic nucleotide-binding domain-containing protein [Candidatus Latescibacterota bacterium]
MSDLDNENAGDKNHPGKNIDAQVDKHYKNLMAALKKIPMFHGLTMDQYRTILAISIYRKYDEDTILFSAGDESEYVFILIQGGLKVVLSDGKAITRIDPPGIVGEMGVFTGQNRSATIITTCDSIVLVISRIRIMGIFKNDESFGIKILMNIIKDISDKIRRDNRMIEFLYHGEKISAE